MFWQTREPSCMIKLSDKLYAMIVPAKASDIQGHDDCVTYYIDDYGTVKVSEPGIGWMYIGCVNSDSITFDCKPHVNLIHVEEAPSPFNDMGGGWHYSFVDYMNPGEYAGWQGDAGCYRKSEDSMRSLLESNGICWKSKMEPNIEMNFIDSTIGLNKESIEINSVGLTQIGEEEKVAIFKIKEDENI